MTVKAVVFDLDGTLVETEPLSAEAWRIVLGRRGFQPSPEQAAWVVGVDFDNSRDYFHQFVELPEVVEAHAEYAEVLSALMQTKMAVFDDTADLLDALVAEGTPVGICSNSVNERIVYTAQAAGRGWEQLPRTGGDEGPIKPSPVLLGLLADKLGVHAHECLVLEDTDMGEQAALAGGALCLRVDQLRLANGDLAAQVRDLLGR